MSSGLAAFAPIVVVPVFNEAETIGEVVAAARAHAPVLVVDDGSDDGSAAAARAAGAEVLRHPRRLGKGQAVRPGVAAARSRRASVVVTLDGDGQHDPGDLTAVLGAARGAPRAIVVGSRLAEAGVLPPDRLNAIRVAGFFVNWASGLKLEDTQSGYRAYPVTLFDEIELRHGGFVLETEVLIAAAGRGWQVREVPVQAIPRARRRSRFRPLGDGAAIGAYPPGRGVGRWARAGGARRRAGGVGGPEPPPAPRGRAAGLHHERLPRPGRSSRAPRRARAVSTLPRRRVPAAGDAADPGPPGRPQGHRRARVPGEVRRDVPRPGVGARAHVLLPSGQALAELRLPGPAAGLRRAPAPAPSETRYGRPPARHRGVRRLRRPSCHGHGREPRSGD